MQEERIKILLAYIQEEPNEPFNYYALAIEYVQTSPEKALEQFEFLLKNHPNYLATYYHVATLYADLDQTEKAKQIYVAGILLAEKQQNNKTLDELKRAYRGFLEELEC
jgi:Tfp pilus assembly protein PilF